MALPFSLPKLRAEGAAFAIIHNSVVSSVSRDGTLVFPLVDAWPQIQLAWHDFSGHQIKRVGYPDAIETMSLSPEGRRIAFNLIQRSGSSGIWILDVSGGTKNRLTFSAEQDYHPIWAPTGKEITFCSNRLGHFDIYTIPVGGGDEPKLLVGGPLNKIPDDWSSDGQFLVYEMEDPKTGQDLWYLKPKQSGGYESMPVLRTPANEESGRFSPDGRFLAYVSDESGRREVYVRRFPDGSEVRQISVNGGRLPSWRKDGKELFYLQGKTLVAVPIKDDKGVLTIGDTRPLFDSPSLTEVRLSAYFYADLMYAVSDDGQRVLFPEIIGPVAAPVTRVVENWFEEFRARSKHGR
jgi:Tol biopolymer transport system component